MKSSKYKHLFSDTLIFAIGTIGSKLIVFFLLPIYTNALSSEEYGVADYIITLSEIIRPFVSLAIYNALLRYGLSKNEKKEDVVLGCVIVFLIGTVASIIITPLFGLYETISEWKWCLCAYTVIVFLHKIAMINLKISDKNKMYAVLSIVQAFVTAILSILSLVVLKRGISGYLLSSTVAYAITSVLALFLGEIWKDLKKASYNADLMRKMIGYSLPFIANDISWFFIHSSDKFMIESMINQEALGIYTAASKIPLLVTVVASIFSQAWDIAVVREYEEDNDRNYFTNVFNYFCIFVIGLTIGLITIIKPFMSIYVGEEFFSAWMYVPLLAIASALSAFSSFLGAFYSAEKNSVVIMKSTIIAAIVNIICNFILIKKIGIWGAVIGTVIAYFILTLRRLRGISKKLGLHGNRCKFLFLFFIVCLQALAASFDFHILKVSLVCICIYFVLVYKDFLKMFIILKKKIRK